MGNQNIQEEGAGGFDQFHEGVVQVLFLMDGPGWYAESFGNGEEVGIGGMLITRTEVSMGPVAAEEAVFPLDHHTQVLIVEQKDFSGDFFGIGSGQFLDIHQEAAIAIDVDDQVIRSSDFGAEGRRQAKPHGAQTTAGDPGAGLIEVEELGGPHLMLADPGGDDGAMEQASVPQQFPEPADGVLGQNGILTFRNTQRIAGPPFVDLPPPVGITPTGDQIRIRLLLQHSVEVR